MKQTKAKELEYQFNKIIYHLRGAKPRKGNIMQDAKIIEQHIFELQAKIEHAENHSSRSIEDESRLDDLHCELLKLEEMIA